MEYTKTCYGKCERCAWRYNGGCSEWNGFNVKELEETDECEK